MLRRTFLVITLVTAGVIVFSASLHVFGLNPNMPDVVLSLANRFARIRDALFDRLSLGISDWGENLALAYLALGKVSVRLLTGVRSGYGAGIASQSRMQSLWDILEVFIWPLMIVLRSARGLWGGSSSVQQEVGWSRVHRHHMLLFVGYSVVVIGLALVSSVSGREGL